MRIEILYPVETETELLQVWIDAEVITENNGVGLHDFQGLSSFDAGEDAAVIGDLSWDESLYTVEQNHEIELAIKSKHFEDAVMIKYFNSFDI